MKSPKVSYKIQRSSFSNPLEVTIDLSEIEKKGLSQYLYDNGLISNVEESVSILSRFIIIPPREDKQPTKSKTTPRSTGNFESRESLPLKKYRVDLHSNDYFKNSTNVQQFVDVVAVTKGKALMIAMNKIGLTNFPDNWGSMEVIPGSTLDDFGMYALSDDNNPYVKKKTQDQYS